MIYTLNYVFIFTYVMCTFCTNITVSPALRHQFQCINDHSYELCLFPDEYCHSDGVHSECRPCTKDICDRLHKEDFPLQCGYNCTADNGKKEESQAKCKKEESQAASFITDHADLWFGALCFILACDFVILVSIPIWKYVKRRRLEEKLKGHTDPELPEKLPLTPKGKDDNTPSDNNSEHRQPEDSVEAPAEKEVDSTVTGPYCESKLKNVNPTDGHSDMNNTVLTNVGSFRDETAKKISE